MFTDLNQSRFIMPKTTEFVNLWLKGIDAVTTINTAAIESGMPVNDAFQVFQTNGFLILDIIKPEAQWLAHSKEAKELIEDNPEEDKTFRSFRHDIGNWMFGYSADMKENPTEWRNGYGAGTFTLHPSIAQMVAAIKIGTTVDRGSNEIRLVNSVPFQFMLASSDMYASTRNILSNLISNSIKYGGRNITVSMVEPTLVSAAELVVKDDGGGMDQAFADKLGKEGAMREGRMKDVNGSGIGWQSIAESAETLGWKWKILSEPGEGTKVTFFLNRGDLVEIDPDNPKDFSVALKGAQVDLSECAKVFLGAFPFAGYKKIEGGFIDISNSPIYRAIQIARPLALQMGVLIDGAPLKNSPALYSANLPMLTGSEVTGDPEYNAESKVGLIDLDAITQDPKAIAKAKMAAAMVAGETTPAFGTIEWTVEELAAKGEGMGKGVGLSEKAMEKLENVAEMRIKIEKALDKSEK